LRQRTLLQDIECSDSIRFTHGGKVENLFDEEIRSGAGRNGRLAQVHEFRRAFAEHLNSQHPRAGPIAQQRQES
jgi:hypothetical protein